jgi:ATP-dependent RNA helicase DDX41
VSSHGGKSQEEREMAVKVFKHGKADVLVATDVAAKGLDFPDVQVCMYACMHNLLNNIY